MVMDKQNKIRILNEDLISKIAAGEIIERPASVVKELVENAIDAGSTRIEVEIRDGGRELIRVTDNGIGMSADDARLAFSRHATSKLSKEEDLYSIMTLGFRGEALPSIGAIARVELATRRWSDESGAIVRFEAGSLVDVSPVGIPPGTTITVRHLFYNVPARLKFLKSSRTEAKACVSMVSNLALAHPEIAFQMVKDDEKVLITNGSGHLPDAIMGVYGTSIVKDLVEFNFGREDIRIRGYISRPESARKNRSYQVFFVNGRYFQSGLIRSALDKGFEGYVPRGRFPVAVLDIRIDPSNVDVNVHPAKMEIKFRDEQAVFQAVMLACKRTLGRLSPFTVQDKVSDYSESLEEEQIQASFDLFKVLPVERRMMHKYSETYQEREHIREKFYDNDPMKEVFSVGSSEFVKETGEYGETDVGLREYSIIGQMHFTYILVQVEDGLLIIDQHAAHERIVYEMLSREEDVVESQVLLVPEVIELDRDAFQLMEETMALFTQAGFEIEVFGSNTFMLRAMPAYLQAYNPQTVIKDILDELVEAGKDSDVLKKRLNIVISCKTAVKAGDTLNMQEMEELVSRYFNLSDVYTCPHGRPVAIRMTLKDLEKRFFRTL
jgi:DNA mismatch repair protein MutL